MEGRYQRPYLTRHDQLRHQHFSEWGGGRPPQTRPPSGAAPPGSASPDEASPNPRSNGHNPNEKIPDLTIAVGQPRPQTDVVTTETP